MKQLIKRTEVFYRVILIILIIFVVRLFDVQVIDYHSYEQQALMQQFEATKIPASRGLIEAQQGNGTVPIVLNQELYTLYGDPTLVKNRDQVAQTIARTIGGSASSYSRLLTAKNTQYVILAHKISSAQSHKILSYQYPGIGTQGQDYRIYPDGDLAAQVLGFVNNNGKGEYGIEQALNKELSGTPGELKAFTTANGIPLVAEPGNIEKQPVPGNDVVLTLNTSLQSQLEQALSDGLKSAHSNSGSALIMNIHTGAVVAMANEPSYNPGNYNQVSDPATFINNTVGTPLEVGSIMKTITTSTALNIGAITPNETFFDPAKWVVDSFTITDIAQDGGPQQRSITDILVDSLNTGATWELMQMGGGQINNKARTTWYDYMVNHYHFGSASGIEQGYEAAGYVPSPIDYGNAIDLTYANTSFGQGTTETPIQMAAALSSILNGGTYYIPTLVAGTISQGGKYTANPPKIWKTNVVGPTVGPKLEKMMETVTNTNYYFYQMSKPQPGYVIGGKTGTAQITMPGGGYYPNEFNGTFIGFIGSTSPQYVIMIEVNQPVIPNNSIDTFAGAGAAAPIFGKVINAMIQNGFVAPS